MSDSPAKTTRLGKAALLALLLALAWLLWSGFYTPLLLGLGAFSCVMVIYLSHRMGLVDSDLFSGTVSLRLLGYWAWLAKEGVTSSLEVTRCVLNPRLPISPTVAEFDAHTDHPVDLAILGNSITLTPGTLTLQIRGGHFTVHALTESGADDLMSGEMDRRVSELRRR